MRFVLADRLRIIVDLRGHGWLNESSTFVRPDFHFEIRFLGPQFCIETVLCPETA
jgi:hypothetical protein